MTYLHVNPGSWMNDLCMCWYFTDHAAKEGSLMDVFYIIEGKMIVDEACDRKIHGHDESALRSMFRPVDLGAVAT